MGAYRGNATRRVIWEASRVLELEPNRFYTKSMLREIPRMDEYSPFYAPNRNRRVALISRAVAVQQGVVWGTGSHTSTPVLITALGPKKVAARFEGLMHMTGAGKRCMEAFGFQAP